MSNKNKTIDEIQNQNNQSMLKFWQGTEDESSKQNVIAHEDYLCFINGVGIKIGNKIIIKNNKKIDTPTADPATLKFGDRIDNKATVVGQYSSNDGKKYAFAVLDAYYRGTDIAWSTGLYGIDSGLPNYSSAPTEQNKESATYNTDYILNNYSDKNIESFSFCRNVGNLTFNDKTYNCQLPNAYELQQIFNMKTELDALDPTAEANSTKKLSNWGFGSQYTWVWSSNAYNDNTTWFLKSDGSWDVNPKDAADTGVVPIIEIPISNNTPSEETSKEFTITSNASNATILVNEVQ